MVPSLAEIRRSGDSKFGPGFLASGPPIRLLSPDLRLSGSPSVLRISIKRQSPRALEGRRGLCRWNPSGYFLVAGFFSALGFFSFLAGAFFSAAGAAPGAAGV